MVHSSYYSHQTRVLAFGHKGFDTTTAATSEPWPLKSCPGLQKSTILVKQQMTLKRSWLKQEKLISKSGQRTIKASYYQNPSLFLARSRSSLLTQGKLFRASRVLLFPALPGMCIQYLQVRHWSLPQGHTHMT